MAGVWGKQVLRSLRSHQDDILRLRRSHQDDQKPRRVRYAPTAPLSYMGTLAESSSGRGVRPSSVRSQPTVVYAEDGRKPLIPGSASLLLVTCRVGFPARWASRVDPVVALRAK